MTRLERTSLSPGTNVLEGSHMKPDTHYHSSNACCWLCHWELERGFANAPYGEPDNPVRDKSTPPRVMGPHLPRRARRRNANGVTPHRYHHERQDL